MDKNVPKDATPPLHRVATVFPQAIASLDISDHEQALCSYLDHYGLKHEHTDSQIIVRDDGGEPLLTATFDEHKRLTHLEAKLEAQAEGTKHGTATEGRPPEDNPIRSPPAESRDEAHLRRMPGG